MIDNEHWIALRAAIDDPARRGTHLEQVVAAIEPADIDILMDRCLSSDAGDAQSAIRVVHDLVAARRLTPQGRADWERTLKTAIGRQPLNSAIWALAHMSLEIHGIDYAAEDRAARGIGRDEYLDISARQDGDRMARTPELGLDEAISRLIAADPAATAAAARLRSLAEAWRARRDAKAIYSFYAEYIQRIGTRRVPLKAIVEVLGRPTKGSDRNASYHVTSGSALYLEADSTGELSAHKCS